MPCNNLVTTSNDDLMLKVNHLLIIASRATFFSSLLVYDV